MAAAMCSQGFILVSACYMVASSYHASYSIRACHLTHVDLSISPPGIWTLELSLCFPSHASYSIRAYPYVECVMAVVMCSQESLLVLFCYLVTSQYRAYYRIRAASFEVDSSKRLREVANHLRFIGLYSEISG